MQAMGDAYPELRRSAQIKLSESIAEEEELRFAETLGEGYWLIFESAAEWLRARVVKVRFLVR